MFEAIARKKILPVLLVTTMGGSVLGACAGNSNEQQGQNAPVTHTSFNQGKLITTVEGCTPHAKVGCVNITITKLCVGKDLETNIHTESLGTQPAGGGFDLTEKVWVENNQASTDYRNPACTTGQLASSDFSS